MMTKTSATNGFTLVEVSIAVLVSVPILFAITSTTDIVTKTVATSEQVAGVSDVLRSTARRVGQLVRPASVATLEGKQDSASFTKYDRYHGTVDQYDLYYDPYMYDSITTDPIYNLALDGTYDPTLDPTYDPTFEPNYDPTLDPTFEPNYDPTLDPIYQTNYETTYDPITGTVLTQPTTTETTATWQPLQNYVPRPSIRFQAATGTLSMNARDLTPPRSIELVRDTKDPLNGIDDDGDGLVDEGSLFLNYDGVRVKLADGIESSTFVLEDRVVRFRLTCAKRDGHGRVHRATIEQRFFLRND